MLSGCLPGGLKIIPRKQNVKTKADTFLCIIQKNEQKIIIIMPATYVYEALITL